MSRNVDRSLPTTQPPSSSDSTNAPPLDPTTLRGQITFLPTADLVATDAFYAGMLGLQLVRDQGVCRIYATAPGAFVGFCDRGYTVPDRYRLVLTLLLDDVEGTFARLREAGAEVVSEPAHSERFAAVTAFVRDPNGYLVELQRFDVPLENAPQG